MKETEFRNFVEILGQWFNGFAKFTRIVSRHNDTFSTGEIHMIGKLAIGSSKIDCYLKECRMNYHDEEVQQLAESREAPLYPPDEEAETGA